jgi:hypothetical protein
MLIIAFDKRIIKKPPRTNPRRLYILINTDYQESATTAAGGDTRAIPPQSVTNDNESVTACK